MRVRFRSGNRHRKPLLDGAARLLAGAQPQFSITEYETAIGAVDGGDRLTAGVTAQRSADRRKNGISVNARRGM